MRVVRTAIITLGLHMEYLIDVAIIGSGPAGYTAAIYTARAGLSTMLFTGAQIGGQLTQTTEVENFPGFPTPIFGADLMERMCQQAKKFGTKIVFEAIVDIDCEARPFVCVSEKSVYRAGAIIIATGATAKWLGIPGEDEFRGYGVSACATCDGFFYRGKNVAVVGGGNVAVSDAIFLSRHADNVTLIHRRGELRAEKILQERLFNNPKISVLWNSVVTEICGEGAGDGGGDLLAGGDGSVRVEGQSVSGGCGGDLLAGGDGSRGGNNGCGSSGLKKISHIMVKTVPTGEEAAAAENEPVKLDVDGIFVAVGHAPQTKLFQNKLRLTNDGYVFTSGSSTQTSVPGIFAAGDVADPRYKQAITAAGSGCRAALEAEEFLASLRHSQQ
jgi:thioredoxin reductase (NADPH)